jgi:PAS domain S-box-containing protein
VKWSPGLEAIHGYAPGAFPGTFEALRAEIHPEDRDRVLHAIADAAEQRRDHHIEYRIVRTDGAYRWVEGRGQLFFDESQQPERMVGVCADITEPKQAEERFRMAVEAAPAAMLLVDERGSVVLANALTEELLGYGRDEIIGQPVDRFVPARFRHDHSPHLGGFFRDPQQRRMGAGRDLHAVRTDGSEVPVEIGLSPIRTADGVFVLAAVTDITERKRAEELLRHSHGGTRACVGRDSHGGVDREGRRMPRDHRQQERGGALRPSSGHQFHRYASRGRDGDSYPAFSRRSRARAE